MPDWSREVRFRLSSLHLAPTREAEIIEELSQHLDDRYRELIAEGASPDEAARLTLVAFPSGNALAQRMASLRQTQVSPSLPPEAPSPHALAGLWRDLRYAARTFGKQPGFAAAAVLTLGLGIGATTTIFSVVYGILLQPLPFPEPERLVNLSHMSADGGRNHGPTTYFTYRDNQRVFEDIGAWDGGQATITGGDAEQVDVLRVNDAFLPLLRVQPQLGRVFSREDDAPGSRLRVILTHGYWQRRFGGVADIVGQPLVIDGRPAEIIGVLPSSFKFGRSNNAVMLLPIQLDRADATDRISFGFQALARLKPDVTMSQADADLARMISLLPPDYADMELRPNIHSQAAYVIGDVGPILWILFAAVGVVLLMAGGNVANLFLVRAEGRQQELAVRAAIGASRSGLARVLLSESVLLALVGGVLGVAFAFGAIGLLRQLAPAQLPRLDEIGLHPAVLIFALGISLLNGAVFGLMAVLKFAKPGAIVLKGGRSISDAPGRHRTRNTLIVVQIAFALVLMVGAGLLIRTVVAMRQVQPGFTRPETVQTFRLSIPETMISDTQQTARVFESVARRLEQTPGVTSVGLSSSITMDGENNGNWIELEESHLAEKGVFPLRFKSFAPGYFETMGIPIVAGRSIDWAEIDAGRPVLLISENLARKYWTEPAGALGKRVRSGEDRPWWEIVGVVGNERDDGLDQPETPIVYWPLMNGYGSTRRTMAYAVRSDRVGAAAFQRELEQAVWSVNPNLPLAAVQTLDEIQDRSMARTSFVMVMLTLAASVALLLAIVGIFGVMTYIATQRTHEIGLRIALGAQPGDVRQMFLRHGFWLTAVGITLGITVALALTRVMSALFFGVGPMDPMTYVAASGVLAAVSLLAMYLPARRASRVDPIIALRANT